MTRIAVIGAGRVGTALARLLARRGWKIRAVSAPRIARARRLARSVRAPIATIDPSRAAEGADLVLIAVPDRAIGDVARRLARGGGRVRSRRIVLHTAGAIGSEILDPLAELGWETGTFHPLVSLPLPKSRASRATPLVSMSGVTVAIEGSPAARRAARRLARSLDMQPLEIGRGHRAAYHLAACMASNYIVTLVAEAASLLEDAGVGRSRSLRALLPLLASTLSALERHGIPRALTGPVARGDDATIGRHARLLAEKPTELALLHGALVRRTGLLARRARWLDAAALRRIERALRSR